MTLFRTIHKDNYTCVNNYILKDSRLSYKAKGIWLYAFSRPDDWEFNITDISNQSADGKDAIKAGLRELSKFGYLQKVQPNEKGVFGKVEWLFYETPILKEILPRTDFPSAVLPSAVNPPLLSTEPKLNTETTNRVAVFACLKEIQISQSDKEWLTSHYDEEAVKHAIKWATHPETTITSSLQQALKWAAKEQPPIPVDTLAASEENLKLAKSVERRVVGKNACVYAGSAAVEVYFTVGSILPVVVTYTDKKFKELFNAALLRFGIQLKEV